MRIYNEEKGEGRAISCWRRSAWFDSVRGNRYARAVSFYSRRFTIGVLRQEIIPDWNWQSNFGWPGWPFRGGPLFSQRWPNGDLSSVIINHDIPEYYSLPRPTNGYIRLGRWVSSPLYRTDKRIKIGLIVLGVRYENEYKYFALKERFRDIDRHDKIDPSSSFRTLLSLV